MGVELTDNEMAIERRAEELKDDKLSDNDEFVAWLVEECPHTPAFYVVMKHLKEGNTPEAVRVFLATWDSYCDAKAYEQARAGL